MRVSVRERLSSSMRRKDDEMRRGDLWEEMVVDEEE